MLIFGYFTLIYCIILFAVIAYGKAYAVESPAKKPLSEIVYVTVSNLRGHRSLYKNGWFVVSSSEKAFRYAKAHSIVASKRAVSHAVDQVKTFSKKFGRRIQQSGTDGLRLGKGIYSGGTVLSKLGLAFTRKLIKTEWRVGIENFKLAWQRFIEGYTSLGKRTTKDRTALAAIPGRWYTTIKSDLAAVRELAHIVKQRMFRRVTSRWGEAFFEAKKLFNDSYEKSGECNNSISGLGCILVGYSKVVFTGVIKPSSRAMLQGTAILLKIVAKLMLLPLSLAVIVCGRTIQSSGLALYHTASIGVQVISPTVEGGLLAGFSVLLHTAIPITAVLGSVAVVANQIALTAACPVAVAVFATIVFAFATSVYVIKMGYTLIAGVAKLSLYQAQSVAVLGYNSLTALSTQLLMGIANIFVLLAYDGPDVTTIDGLMQN